MYLYMNVQTPSMNYNKLKKKYILKQVEPALEPRTASSTGVDEKDPSVIRQGTEPISPGCIRGKGRIDVYVCVCV